MQNTLKKAFCFKAVVALAGVAVLAPAFGATECAWTGGGDDANWSTAANWGGTAPDSLSYNARFKDVQTKNEIPIDGYYTINQFLPQPNANNLDLVYIFNAAQGCGLKATADDAFIFGAVSDQSARKNSTIDITFNGGSYYGNYLRLGRYYCDSTLRLAGGAVMTNLAVRVGNSKEASTAKLLVTDGSEYVACPSSSALFFMCSDCPGTSVVEVDNATLRGPKASLSVGGVGSQQYDALFHLKSGTVELHRLVVGGCYDDGIKTDRTSANSSGRLVMENGSFSVSGLVAVGANRSADAVSEVIVSNGTFTASDTTTIGHCGNGTFAIEGGNVALNKIVVGGTGTSSSSYSGAQAKLLLNGGTLTTTNDCYVGNNTATDSSAALVVSNGTLNVDAYCLYVGYEGSGTVTIEGGTVRLKDTSYGVTFCHNTAGAKGVLNLNGGTLEIPRFRLDYAKEGCELNLNGGTIKATRSTTSFLDANDNLSVTIGGKGVVIETDYDITIAANLTGTGGIVKRGSGTLTLSGSNTFEGDVVVEGGLVRDSTWGYLWTGGSEGTWSTTSRWSPWGSATGYPDDSADTATFTNSATIKTTGHVSFGKLRLAAGTTLTRSWTSDDNWWCFGTADVIPVPGLETKATIRLASRGLGPGKTSSDADMTIPENITLETTEGWIEGVNKWLTVNGPLVLNKTDNLEVYGNVVLNGPITANYGITFKNHKNGNDISSDYRFMVGESAKFTGSGAVNLESSDSAKMRWMGDWAGSGAFTVNHALDWYGKMSGSGNMTIASKITTFHEGSSGEGYSGTLTVNTTGCSFNTADIFSPDANYVFSKAATLNLGTGTANMGTFSPSATTTVNIGLANDGSSATGCGKIVAGGAIDLSKLSISFTNDNYSALIAASGLSKFMIVKAAMLTGASTLSTPVNGWTLQTFASDGGMALALVPSTTAVKAKWNGSDWTFYDTTGAVASSDAWSDDITLEIDGEFGEDMSAITYGGVEISGANAKLTRDYDWTDHAVTLDAGALLDLNGHNIVLGSYEAGTGAVVTNGNDGAMSVFAPGKNNGIMSGNASVTFGGNLQVALVNVTDATGFSTSILNTHTGGWLFATNNTAIAMRTDASGMGPGPVRYAGRGGFTQEGSNSWSDNTTARDIYIEGDGNRFVTSNQKDYPQYPRYGKIWHGTGEFIIQVNQDGNKGVPELGDSNSNFSDFAGTFRIQGTGFSFERGVLLWTNATGDFANAKNRP